MEFVPFELKKIVEFIPLCIIIVIILISTLTWNVITDKIEYLITLIIIFVWAIYLYIGDSKSIWNWQQNGGELIIPAQPLIDTLKWRRIILICIGVLICGITLGVNSFYKDKPEEITSGTGFIFVGSIFTILSIIGGIYIIYKIFRPELGADANAANKKNIIITPLSLLGIAVGAYMINTGQNIDKNKGEDGKPIDETKIVRVDMKNVYLVSGLFLQIISVIGILAIFYITGLLHRRNDFSATAAPITFGIIIVKFIVCATLFISGLAISAKDGKDPVYISHGAVYIILSCIAIVLCIGSLRKFETYKYSGIFLLLLIFGIFMWNIDRSNLDIIKKSEFELGYINQPDSVYNTLYQQIREEAILEAKQKGIDYNSNTLLNKIIQKRLDKLVNNRETYAGVNIGVSLISLVLVILMAMFRIFKHRIMDLPALPSDGFWTIFIGEGQAPPGHQFAMAQYLTHDNIDNITGNDWNNIISQHDANVGAPNNFNTAVVNAAAASRSNMFISVILIILWVIVIYNYVTTSEKTDIWIANSFDVSMYSKVKELIGAFFITILVALSVAAVLLIPVIKEFNSEGVDNLLKFAESIQVWQWDVDNDNLDRTDVARGVGIAIILWILLMIPIWIWLNKTQEEANKAGAKRILPDGLIVYTIIVSLFCFFGKAVIYFNKTVADNFSLETPFIRYFRAFLSTLYLIPLSAWTVVKIVIWALLYLITFFKMDVALESLRGEWDKITRLVTGNLNSDVDLRFFGDLFGNTRPTPATVSSIIPPNLPLPPDPTNKAAITIDQSKVSVITKLIKSIIIIVSCVLVVLTIVYGFYQFKQKSFTSTTADGKTTTTSTAGLDPATTTFIYLVLVVIGIAGIVAYIRDKMQKSGTEDPERLIFDHLQPEDENKPARQLTFALTHVIYIALMIIVWIYDREEDKDNKMSILGMAILGTVILFFHFGLEVIDSNDVAERVNPPQGAPQGAGPQVESNISILLKNIRFLVNVVFFIVLCILSYFKLHELMVLFIIIMFMFHLTKSKIGILILKLLWSCIIYIPCLILDAIVGGRNMVGSTTRPIWIILIVELILLGMLFGLPYLINKIGTSESQVILAPVPLHMEHDTKLTTESKEIFIYHNTGTTRTAADANCPPEEKKRYSYSVSGWFWLNDNITNIDKDLTIFNFANVPKLTYNPAKTNFKVSCNTIGLNGSDVKSITIYESHNNITQNDDYKEFVMASDLQITKQIPLQRWNYFVINYDGKSMNVFLNEELVGKSAFIMPHITVERITTGEKNGLRGNISNIIFNKIPLTTEQIRWNYNTLKALDPPLIGTSTIVDEVNNADNTDIYTK
jgi:hypothetical protein